VGIGKPSSRVSSGKAQKALDFSKLIMELVGEVPDVRFEEILEKPLEQILGYYPQMIFVKNPDRTHGYSVEYASGEKSGFQSASNYPVFDDGDGYRFYIKEVNDFVDGRALGASSDLEDEVKPIKEIKYLTQDEAGEYKDSLTARYGHYVEGVPLRYPKEPWLGRLVTLEQYKNDDGTIDDDKFMVDMSERSGQLVNMAQVLTSYIDDVDLAVLIRTGTQEYVDYFRDVSLEIQDGKNKIPAIFDDPSLKELQAFHKKLFSAWKESGKKYVDVNVQKTQEDMEIYVLLDLYFKMGNHLHDQVNIYNSVFPNWPK